MIDEKEILPFNFFSYGGVYSGDHNGMRYMIKRTGKKPDFTLNAPSINQAVLYDGRKNT